MVEIAAYQYDNGGVGDSNMTQEIDYPGDGAAPRVTQYYNDWRDRQVAEKQGVTLNGSGEVNDTTLAEVAADGVQRPITYDVLDNLGEVTAEYVYAGRGVAVSTTDGLVDKPDASLLRSATNIAYDDQGQVYQLSQDNVNQTTGTDSGASATTNLFYDADGNLIQSIDPMEESTTYVYDGANRLVQETDPDPGDGATATVTVNAYDNDGNLLSSSVGDPAQTASYVYDDAGRPVSETDPDGSVTSYAYDAAGNLASLTDPDENATSYTYDNLGRVTGQSRKTYESGASTSYASVSESFSYDGDGNVTSGTDYDGNATFYQYDIFGNMTSELWGSLTSPTATFTYTYDNLGEMLTAAACIRGRFFGRQHGDGELRRAGQSDW